MVEKLPIAVVLRPPSWAAVRALACVVLKARISVVDNVPICAVVSEPTWVDVRPETCVVVRALIDVVERPATCAVDVAPNSACASLRHPSKRTRWIQTPKLEPELCARV